MKLTEHLVSENNGNSPKHSYSSVDSNETICEPYCFGRYRENSISDNGYQRMDHYTSVTTPTENDIAKFCQESIYSYSFTNTPMTGTGMRRLSMGTGRNKYERNSMGCLQLIRSKLDMDFGRRYSQPNIGLEAKQHSQQHQHQHQHQRKSQRKPASLSTIGNTCSNKHFANEKSNSYQNNNGTYTDSKGFLVGDPPIHASYSSLPTSPVLWDYTATSTTSDPRSTTPNERNKSEPHLDPTSCLDESSLQQQQQHKDTDTNDYDTSIPPWLHKPTSAFTAQPCGNMDDLSRTLTQSLATNTATTSTCASRYLRALHTPTRFLPQQQAILTTDDDGKLLLFNDMTCLCLDIDRSYIGRSIFPKLGQPSRHLIAHRLRERKKQLRWKSTPLQRQQLPVDHGGMVLMCGTIVPIIKSKGQKSTASLWLKEKWNQVQGRFVYLWIFEEIYESRLTVVIDNEGTIQDTSLATIENIYGYRRWEVIGRPISKILPSLDIAAHLNTELMNKPQFYASRSKDGRYFPSMVQLKRNEMQITSLPTISGLITIHQNGLIQSMNPVPAKYLFGYKTNDIVDGAIHIDSLLPQFMELVILLDRQQLLRHDRMVTSEECLHVLRESSSSSSSHHDSTTRLQTYLTAVHRDGSRFDVELKIRYVESGDENLYSVWITHNRISSPTTTSELQHPVPKNTSTAPQSTSAQHLLPNTCTTGDDMTSSDEDKESKSDTICETALRQQHQQQQQYSTANDRHGQMDKKHHHQQKQQQQQHLLYNEEEQQSPSKLVSSGRFESFGSVPKEKALFPGMQNDSATTLVSSSSECPPGVAFPADFDDYVVTETLGEGAYGAARLAYLKSDPSQEFVIKAIVKSRIIIDSWVRDRKHGSIPTEIHVLLKLQQNPHINCPQLVTYIEDDDNYYTVTRLHGNGMDLFDYIELNDHMTEEQVRRIFRQVAAAIQHLHHLRIVHRDIKDENILLDERGIVQLIDFGSAAYYREGRLFDTFSGTLDYCATEILNGMAYAGPPQDMWSLGVLLYTLIYRETPFYSVDDIMERNLQLPYVPFPDKAVGLVDLLYKLLDRDIDQRPTIDQVMQNLWVQSER